MDSNPNDIYAFLTIHPRLEKKKSNLKYSQKNIDSDTYGYRYNFKCGSKLIANQIIPGHYTHTPSPCEWGYINTTQIKDILTDEEKKYINSSNTLRISKIKFNRFIELVSILININTF